MTKEEKQRKIEQYRKFILIDAEEIADALKGENIEVIYTLAQYIISDYAWIQSLERVEAEDERTD